jgi:hypothetical protein
MKDISKKEGFISLFTVLLATVILAIAVGMSSIALKQIVLSSTADDANEAFYSADSGLQCAIMLDTQQDAFGVGAGTPVDCGGNQGIVVGGGGNSFNFAFDWVSTNNNNCVNIKVEKIGLSTRIEALGYNVSCAEVGTSPKVVERALRVRY